MKQNPKLLLPIGIALASLAFVIMGLKAIDYFTSGLLTIRNESGAAITDIVLKFKHSSSRSAEEIEAKDLGQLGHTEEEKIRLATNDSALSIEFKYRGTLHKVGCGSATGLESYYLRITEPKLAECKPLRK